MSVVYDPVPCSDGDHEVELSMKDERLNIPKPTCRWLVIILGTISLSCVALLALLWPLNKQGAYTLQAGEPKACFSPRYIFFFTPGHAGSTTLGKSSTYLDGPCRVKSSHFFFEKPFVGTNAQLEGFHECNEGRRDHRSCLKGLRKWFLKQSDKPLLERQVELVRTVFLPLWSSGRRAIVAGHDQIFYYPAIPQLINHSEMMFIHVVRDRLEVAKSYDVSHSNIAEASFSYTPLQHPNLNILNVSKLEWDDMAPEEQSLWYVDELNARWIRFKDMYPEIQTMTVHWSKESQNFDSMANQVAGVLGFTLPSKIENLRHHTDQKAV